MIGLVSSKISNNSGISFTQEPEKKQKYSKDTLLKNNIATRTRISFDKLGNALTLYPAKGLTGSKNSNFYEFLTMGTVPYLVGSFALMSVFNSANHFFSSFAETKASKIGGKMALGVLFYGVAKELSKSLITKPIKFATGVDTEVPYAKVNYELPEYKDDTDITSTEYHKVFESVEFPYWDMLYGDESKGEKRNAYFDNVAKKLGLGENLKDSDQEVKPRIKEIVTKTQTVKNIVPYLWAAVGVGVAFQKPWEDIFPVGPLKAYRSGELGTKVKSLGTNFIRSIKEFYTGGQGAQGIQKWAGKGLLLTAVLATIIGDSIILSSSKKPSKVDSSDVIEKSRKYIVN